MKIVITVKDTDNVIGLKEDIAMRLEGVTDIVRIDTADVAPKSEVEKVFAEIEKIINEPFAVGFNLLAPLKQALNDYNNGIRKDLLYYVAELKKKYTEGKE